MHNQRNTSSTIRRKYFSPMILAKMTKYDDTLRMLWGDWHSHMTLVEMQAPKRIRQYLTELRTQFDPTIPCLGNYPADVLPTSENIGTQGYSLQHGW